MRVRILLVLSTALLFSISAATAAARSTAGQQLCAGYSGTYATQTKASFFRPFTRKQKALWACNSYSGGSTSTQALVQACATDGGQATSTLDGPPGFATCWKTAG